MKSLKSEFITLRMTAAQKEQLQQSADSVGWTVSEYVLRALEVVGAIENTRLEVVSGGEA